MSGPTPTWADAYEKDRSKRHVIMFQDRFVDAIRLGRKRQTIRPHRKRAIRGGDTLDARRWTGKPYRSKQEQIGEFGVAWVANVKISTEQDFVFLTGAEQDFVDLDMFAEIDGFPDWQAMREWFRQNHGPDDFEGILIRWVWDEEWEKR